MKLTQTGLMLPFGSPLVLAIFFAGVLHFGAADALEQRPFDVRDSVEMARIVESGLISPDGRYIVTVTERGQISQNSTEATIWLFETDAVRRAINQPHSSSAVPQELIRMSASINGGGGVLGHGTVITRITWGHDGGSLLFLGRDGRENRQLFRVNVRDHKRTALSLSTQDVVDYAVSSEHVAYLAAPNVEAEKAWWANDPSAPDIVVGTGRSLWDVLFPNFRKNTRYMPTLFQLWRASETPAPVVDSATNQPMQLLGSYNFGAFALSHDGSKLILVAHVDSVPKLWEAYEVPTRFSNWPYRATPEGKIAPLLQRQNDYAWPVQYQLVDLAAGTRQALIPAPAADDQRGLVDDIQVAWSPDDRAAVITGTFLPLTPEGTGSKRPCGAAVVHIADRQSECLVSHLTAETEAVTKVSWTEARTVAVEAGESVLFKYRDTERSWRSEPHRLRRAAPSIELTVEEDLNHPPVVAARDTRTGKTRTILDPNPQLKEIALGEVSVYTWKSSQGLDVTGGLAKPPNFVRGQRYPLVIQTHGFPRDQFFRVGYQSETANAGRAIAARGMLVLQVQEPRTPDDGTWREGTSRGTHVYLGAIDQLVADGLVDPQKVAITGYSRAGGFVMKAITEAPDRFAAAAVVNTDLGSQFGYYTYIDYDFPGNAKRIADFFAGSLPYGNSIDDWIKRSPGFNTDKIQAAVLVSAGDPQHLLSLWSLYAPLVDQHKPVELQYFRNGQHNLTKPTQVVAHQEMLVDWFDFWLQGREVQSEAKGEQYTRWRALRESQTK